MMIVRALIAGAAAFALQGCLVSSAVNVATMPVRAAGKAADWATTSQSESDRNRGREMRKREERYGELEREYAKLTAACNRGDERSCSKVRPTWDEMQALKATLPPPPPDRS